MYTNTAALLCCPSGDWVSRVYELPERSASDCFVQRVDDTEAQGMDPIKLS